MTQYFIIPADLCEQTNWQAAPYAKVAPVLVQSGYHAGRYAVNTKIFESDECFEKYRQILEPLPTSDLNGGQDLVAEETTQE